MIGVLLTFNGSCSSVWILVFFFFKQKTAYELRISDWSSDVCSSDLDGIEIYEYMASYLHAKVAVVDRCAMVGSSNLDPFSLLLAREANVRSEERRVGKECVSTCRSRW